MMQRRAGIKDVAALAGVSPATVSRALNVELNTLVAACTRERVLAAVESLAYSPNPLAVGMQKGRSFVVGMVIDTLSDAYLAGRLIDGVQTALWARGMLLAVAGAMGVPDRQESVFKTFHERRVDGVIYAATSFRTVNVASELPLVLLNVEPEASGIACVVPDSEAGAETAVTELRAAGHTRIGFVGPAGAPAAMASRLRGFLQAVTRLGLQQDPEFIILDGDPTAHGGRVAVRRLLELSARPSGILCYDDRMALGAYQAAKDLGVNVPEGLSIIGFENHDPSVAEALSPELTTIALPYFEMGSFASDAILGLIGGSPLVDVDERRMLVPCYLNRRCSVAAPSID